MDTKGLVFDIQRFSLHDGPGIRTTVFLKGCPLDCIWCHNPESKSFKPQVSYDGSRCTDCMACIKACNDGAHKNISGKHVFDFSHSSSCGKCADACIYGALKVIGAYMTVNAVMEEIVKDIDFYNNSGGGMTVSGGEPFAQFEFTLKLLKKSKELGISTCIETCGVTTKERLKKIIPFTDLFLFDYKASDENLHKEFTGSGNRGILSNFEFLYEHQAQIILRCPLIPGVNDSKEHLRAIAAIAVNYPLLSGIEIMPYHNLGLDKSLRIGEVPGLNNKETTGDEKKKYWLEVLNSFNCNNVIIS